MAGGTMLVTSTRSPPTASTRLLRSVVVVTTVRRCCARAFCPGAASVSKTISKTSSLPVGLTQEAQQLLAPHIGLPASAQPAKTDRLTIVICVSAEKLKGLLAQPHSFPSSLHPASVWRLPQVFRQQAMHVLFARGHAADAAIHRHARQAVGIEARDALV